MPNYELPHAYSAVDLGRSFSADRLRALGCSYVETNWKDLVREGIFKLSYGRITGIFEL